jgi:hypothetical protein
MPFGLFINLFTSVDISFTEHTIYHQDE